jgi:hypothetical protein
MLLETVAESLSRLTFRRVYEAVFFSDFFPVYFIPQAIFSCFYLRVAAVPPGITWWRSFTLGLLLSCGTNFVTNMIHAESYPVDEFRSLLWTYAIVWLSFNISPFDFVFRFFNRPSLTFLVACLNQFCATHCLFVNLLLSTRPYPTSVSAIFLIVLTVYGFPPFIDWLDNRLVDPQRKFMFVPWSYLKRIAVGTGISIFLTGPNPWMSEPLAHLESVMPPAMCAFAFLKSIDLVVTGSPFAVIDFVVPPRQLRALFTYHAAVEAAKRES